MKADGSPTVKSFLFQAIETKRFSQTFSKTKIKTEEERR